MNDLMLVGIDVGQQTHLLQKLGPKLLRLVNDHDHAPASAILGDEKLREHLIEFHVTLARVIQAECERYPTQQLLGATALGVGYQTHRNVRIVA